MNSKSNNSQIFAIHPEHQKILEIVEQKARNSDNQTKSAQMKSRSYSGSDKPGHGLKNAVKHQIIRQWKIEHLDLAYQEYIKIVDSLFHGQSSTEIHLAADLLHSYQKLRRQLELKWLDRWLSLTKGWAEIDTLCQSGFTALELESRWDQWQPLLRALNSSSEISKRRASLVLLIKPLRKSQDLRLIKQAFDNIDRLKSEDDVLITKAISWLLREMTKQHLIEVKQYLQKEQASLPAIAVRETWKKIKTGKKN